VRVLAAWLLASGCQLAFPFERDADSSDDGPRPELAVVGPTLAQPPPFKTNAQIEITADFIGEGDVHYRWTTDVGMVEPAAGTVTLADGEGSLRAPWMAPATFAGGPVTLEASYDPDFLTDVVSDTVDVEVHQQFNVSTDEMLAIAAEQILATPIDIPMAGRVINISIAATGMGQVHLALYSDSNMAPMTRLGASGGPLLVDATPGPRTFTYQTPIEIGAGRIWLAVLVKPMSSITIATDDISATGLLRTARVQGTFSALPTTFPASVNNPVYYGLGISVGPPR
jgi:hypothetical protein